MGGQAHPRIEIDAWHNGSQVVCSVSDNGMGIEPSYHERIFNLFERLDTAIDGTGIGMSLVRRILEAHGGSIRVESAGFQRGSKFILTLPQRPASGG